MTILTKLTAEYRNLICKDYYKDRDCHFYINKIYSYGNKPYYHFEHHGYCWSVEKFFQDKNNKKYQEKQLNTIECQFYYPCDVFPRRQTKQEAEQDMKIFLEWAIKKEKENDKQESLLY